MRRIVFALLLCAPLAAPAAQEMKVAFAERGPRFLLASERNREPVRVDVAKTPVLRQRIALDLRDVSVHEALQTIARESGVQLMYSEALVSGSRAVTLRAEAISVAAALSEVLLDAGVDVLFSSSGNAALIRRPVEARVFVGTISGTVTEAATGNPVARARVSVSGVGRGATSGEDGKYSIVGVPAGMRTVSVRRLGYDPQSREVSVSDGGVVTADFALVGAATRLAEIVTSATGGQRRVEMGNAIAVVKADSLMEAAPVMSFGDLINGRSPGVMSIQESGKVGQAGTIRIRGINSALISNDPVVIIDGVRVEASMGGGPSGFIPEVTSPRAGGYSGRMADFDPNEIASVEVVKGPSAATLYGTDAANGVLVITTKRGQSGRPRTTVFTEYGRITQSLDLETTVPSGWYAFGRNTSTNAQMRCTLELRAAGTCVTDSLSTFNTFLDPATRPIKPSARQQVGLQMSGGIGNATYFLSGDVAHDVGTAYMPEIDQAIVRQQRGTNDIPSWQIRPNAGTKVNARGNVTMPIGRRASATLSSAFVTNNVRQTSMVSSLGSQAGYRDANDGWFISGGSGNLRPAYAFARRNNDDVRRFIGSLSSTYAATDWLTLRGTLGADLSSNVFALTERRGEKQPVNSPVAALGMRSLHGLNITRYSLDLNGTATHHPRTDVAARTSVGVQLNRRSQIASSIVARNLPIGGVTLTGSTILGVQEGTIGTGVAGGYVEETLSFRERLFVTGAARFDGGSAFGEGFSVAVYPKVSASWLVREGGNGRRLGWVNSVRLRSAYGTSGVQPGSSDALATVTVFSGLNLAGNGATPGGTLAPGNPELRPERMSEIEGGLDLELWNSRARLELTAYQKMSTDALVRRPVAPDVATSASQSIVQNLGSVRNRGTEALLNATILDMRQVGVSVTATAAFNDNKLVRLGEGVLTSAPTAQLTRLVEGYPIFGLWGRTYESFADANGNGIIERTEVVLTPVSLFYGPNFPKREATLGPSVQLLSDQLELSGLLQYRGDYIRGNFNGLGKCSTGFSTCREVNDITTPLERQAAAMTRGILGGLGAGLEDASSLLLRELSLRYTLPARYASALRAKNAQLLLAGRNLKLLWKGGDAPFENGSASADTQSLPGEQIGPSTFWLLRMHLTF